MKLRVLGCSGGVSSVHRGVSFLLDGRIALDAGSLASGLDLTEQRAVELVLLTHAHLDHVGDLPAIVDLRFQQGGPPLVVAGLEATLDALRAHVFNGVLWPDFTSIPGASGPVLEYRTLRPEEPLEWDGLRALPVPVHHTVPTCGYLVDDGRAGLAFTGDTGPTTRFWEVARAAPRLDLVIAEVSFAADQADLAEASGHLCTTSFAAEVAKLGRPDVPVRVYGLKPWFAERIEAELAAQGDARVAVLAAGEEIEL